MRHCGDIRILRLTETRRAAVRIAWCKQRRTARCATPTQKETIPVEKRLYRPRNDRIIAGVCSGLGHYFNLDPVLIRVLAVIVGFMSFGTLLLLYLVLALIIPLEPDQALITGEDRSVADQK
jgi:phage shock protein C